MKIKFQLFSGSRQRLILVLFVIALFLLIPNTKTMADSNAPTVTNTPPPTDTPIPATLTPIPTAAVTDTPFLIIPTEGDNMGAIAIATLPSSGNSGGLSTLNAVLLMLLGIAIVVVIGIIAYIFINQTRGGLGSG